MQVLHKDFRLRGENIHAFQLAGLDTSDLDIPELICVDDLFLSSQKFPSNKFILVDHNVILPHFLVENDDARVTAVIDHHVDEGKYHDTANPRVIEPVGSCCSLVTRLFHASGLPAELATLLLCAILLDTHGLKEGGKARQADYEAAAFLVPRSTFAASVEPNFLQADSVAAAPALMELTAELSSKKDAVAEIETKDLLRRDYKQYVLEVPWAGQKVAINAGLATVPLGLRDWMGRDDFWGAAREWMEERRLSVFGILTSFRDETHTNKHGKPKHRREMVWLLKEEIADSESKNVGSLSVDALAEKLWKGIKASSELSVKHVHASDVHDAYGADLTKVPPTMRAKVYKQGNADATRKVTAPLMKQILEDSSSTT